MEVAPTPDAVLVRDSKDRDGPEGTAIIIDEPGAYTEP